MFLSTLDLINPSYKFLLPESLAFCTSLYSRDFSKCRLILSLLVYAYSCDLRRIASLYKRVVKMSLYIRCRLNTSSSNCLCIELFLYIKTIKLPLPIQLIVSFAVVSFLVKFMPRQDMFDVNGIRLAIANDESVLKFVMFKCHGEAYIMLVRWVPLVLEGHVKEE